MDPGLGSPVGYGYGYGRDANDLYTQYHRIHVNTVCGSPKVYVSNSFLFQQASIPSDEMPRSSVLSPSSSSRLLFDTDTLCISTRRGWLTQIIIFHRGYTSYVKGTTTNHTVQKCSSLWQPVVDVQHISTPTRWFKQLVLCPHPPSWGNLLKTLLLLCKSVFKYLCRYYSWYSRFIGFI